MFQHRAQTPGALGAQPHPPHLSLTRLLWLYWPTCSFPSSASTVPQFKPLPKLLSFPCLSGMPRSTSHLNARYSHLCQATLRRLSCSFFVSTAFCLQPPLPVSQEFVCLFFHQTLSSLKAGEYVLSFYPPISAVYNIAKLTVVAQSTFTGQRNRGDHLCPS